MIMQDGLSSMLACQQMLATCKSRLSARDAKKPLVCVCLLQQQAGQVFVRFYASQTPRQVGLSTAQGDNLGVYDFSVLRVDIE